MQLYAKTEHKNSINMKKVIIGTIVGAFIYFGYQAMMWLGGFHNDFTSYTPRQHQIMGYLSQNIISDGLYMMPYADPDVPDQKKERQTVHNENVGRPWAMIFYHNSMPGMAAGVIVKGLFYTLIACFIASLVLYYGGYSSFWARFGIAMAFAIFALMQGVFDNMTWWSFPWSFVKTKVIDLTLGWGICSIWLAMYVRRRVASV